MKLTWEKTFDAAHFLPGHHKCGRLHGHTYRAFVVVEASGWKSVEHPHYVIDYGEIKDIIMKLDHKLLIATEHEDIQIEHTEIGEHNGEQGIRLKWKSPSGRWRKIVLPTSHFCLLPITDTSAELLAEHLAEQIYERLLELPNSQEAEHLSVLVEIQETPNTSAEATYP